MELPDGNYLARGTSLVWGESSAKHTPQVTVAFSIQEEGPYKGKLIEWTGYLTDATRERTAESLAICGYDPESADPDGTVGRNVVALVVEEEAYTSPSNGKTYTNARVKWINDPNRARTSGVPIDDAKKQMFRDSMRGLILAQKQAREKRGEPTNSTSEVTAVPPAGVPNQKAMF